jgi:hypothetical protein
MRQLFVGVLAFVRLFVQPIPKFQWNVARANRGPVHEELARTLAVVAVPRWGRLEVRPTTTDIDGQHFLVADNTDSEIVPITLVINWVAALRR